LGAQCTLGATSLMPARQGSGPTPVGSASLDMHAIARMAPLTAVQTTWLTYSEASKGPH